MGERLFDELARALAEPLPRRRALRLLGAAVLGAWVASPRPPARAATRAHVCHSRVSDEGWNYCTNETQGCFPTCCPKERKCCVGPLGGSAQCPTLVSCCDPCNPDGSQCLPDGTCGPGTVSPDCYRCPQADGETCGDTCCKPGEFCAFPEIGKCCSTAEVPCAGRNVKRCCPEGEECCVFEPLPGQPGRAASACCSRDERCLRLKGTCCPKERACGQKACCAPHEECDERDQTCSCPKPRRCNGRCCPRGSTCEKGVCRCKDGNQPCGGSVCCEKGKTCTGGGQCCKPARICGDDCCGPNEECRNLGTGRELERAGVIRRGCAKKCLQGSSPCGATCCTDDTQRCESGTCVPLG